MRCGGTIAWPYKDVEQRRPELTQFVVKGGEIAEPEFVEKLIKPYAPVIELAEKTTPGLGLLADCIRSTLSYTFLTDPEQASRRWCELAVKDFPHRRRRRRVVVAARGRRRPAGAAARRRSSRAPHVK